MTAADDFSVKTIDGTATTLGTYKGSVALVVNVASKCGLTPQYEGLEALYEKYHDKGLVVLGFPCNQFRGQEPGSEAEIKEFCTLNYNVKFPLFSKIDVNGADAHPLYQFLKQQQPGETISPEVIASNRMYQFINAEFPQFMRDGEIKWNFTKFLVGRDGKVLKRYEPDVKPEAIEADIQALLS